MADKEIASFASELGGAVVIYADTVTGLVTKIGTPAGIVSLTGGAGISALTQASDYTTNLVTPLAAKADLVAGKVPVSQLPAAVQGALNYQGAWNASTNSPALTSGTGTKGFFYTVSAAGSTTLDGISQWNAGDHVSFNGTTWEKFDGLASEVLTVAGRTGAVTLATTDLTDAATLTSQSTDPQTGTTYTLVAADAGQNVDMNNASANTCYIPPNSLVAYPVGTLITVTMAGAGITTIAPSTAAETVTLVKPTARSLSISAQYETAQLYKTGTNAWRVLCG